MKSKPTGFQRKGKLFLYSGLALILLGASFAASKTFFLISAERVSGTAVVAGRCPQVDYRDRNGVSHSWTWGCVSPPPFQLNQDVTVWYDKRNPEDAEVAYFWSLWIFSLVPAMVGVMFCLMGMPAMLTAGILAARRRRFMEGAEKISAGIIEVKRIYGRGMDFVYPHRIIAEADIDGRRRVFTSRDIWYEPSGFLDGRNTIDVYYRREDPKRNLIDIDFLPPFCSTRPAKGKDVERVKLKGERLRAKVTDVYGGGRDPEDDRFPWPYTVRAQALVDGHVNVFLGDTWRDPREFLVGDTVEVFYRGGPDPCYVVDMSFMPVEAQAGL
jgi:hypothetical protein